MKENFPSLAKEIDFQEFQEAQRVLKKLDPRKNTPRHIITKLPNIKDKERILKQQEKRRELPTKEFPLDSQLISQEKPCRQEGTGKKVLKVMKVKDLHPRLVYPAKLSFRMGGQIKCFPDKVKLKEFIITKPLLYEM